MAAEASRDNLADNRITAKTQDATGNSDLPKWRPRDGKTLQLERLLDDLRDRLGAAGISEGTLNDPMPSMTQIANRYPNESEDRLRALHEQACQEFQKENKFIWDTLRPTLLIDGIYERPDRQAIRELTTGVERDGRGLLRWSLTYYLDSLSSVHVGKRDKAVKLSAWLQRRTLVLHEASDTEVLIIHIPGADMLADPFTKYLKYETWRRHMKVLLNRPEAF